MKKKVVPVLLAATMACGLTACGITSNSRAEGDGNTVNVYVSSDLESSLDAEIEAYKNVNPAAVIVKHVVPDSDYDNKIKVLLSGGAKDVDVFWARTPAYTNQYQSAGALENLAPYANKSGVDLSSIDSSLSVISDEDGGFYGLPIYSSCWMLFYNKDLFDRAGAAYPAEQMTWDEYCSLAESLTGKDGGTKYWGGQCPGWTMNLGAIAAGEYLTDPAPLEKTKEYLEITKRMYSESHVPLEEMSNGSWDNNASFESGNIYMMILGDWGYRDLECDFEYGTAPLPVLDGTEPGTSVGNACYLCIAKTAKNKQAAYDFIEFYTTSDEGTSVTAGTGNVPCYSTDAAMKVYEESVKIDGIENRFAAKVLREQAGDKNYAAVLEAFKQEAQLYLLGEESIDDCMNNFYKLRDELQKE
ncbi:ABC transporter substrate-binding protein [Clostridium sp. Marseille-P2415]|uniref:ABC transporter substrate-binding protein n=1 Tax=Clostridium sp. Marseille-P2415 TaxID=1805471 RepID=UPI0013564F66|nr:extracellular solute-binding protein [Clostridium sp. Marseille-P2415]